MQHWRSKKHPGVIVEAEKLTADNVDALANWAQAQVILEGRDRPNQEGLNIRTANGKERLHQGMYLVKYLGAFYTAGESNFEQGYELVADRPSKAPKMTTDDPWAGVPRIKP
jgi:hypothetical protein